jgi:hypothetical protein
MNRKLKVAPLPALPIPVQLDARGYTESQLVQYADRIRVRTLLEAAHVCMDRITSRMIGSHASGHTPVDTEALACARAIYNRINMTEDDDQFDLFGDGKRIA